MASIFSKIVSGEIPCHRIAENAEFLAFLDVMPLAKGHTLVIPKSETDYIFDIDDETYARLWVFAKNVARQIESKIPCKKVGISVIGLEVPHAHIHLIPLQNVEDMNFSRPKLQVAQEELSNLASLLRAD
ncbi:MAG: HIT family protein [Flavobacteriales bacterium]